MKSRTHAPRGVAKGGPSGIAISLLAHAAAFFLAGVLVVFTIRHTPDPIFVAPRRTERPKIKIKKRPKARVENKAKPKSAERVVIPMDRVSMPELQLPGMPGVGDQFSKGADGEVFDLVLDLGGANIFGETNSIGNDLEGVIYDFKRLRNGSPSDVYAKDGTVVAVEKFLRSGWKPSSIARYYRSPRKLYTPMIMVPPTESSLGTWAFGENDMDPWAYMFHYKGQLVHKDGIKFRFVCMADNYLVIRVNGEVVLDYKNQFESAISAPPSKPLNYHLGHWFAYGSEWIELEPDEPQEVEFIFGEYSGVLFSTMIAVEEHGVEYPAAPLPLDNPRLPVFKTAELTPDQLDAVKEWMWVGQLDLESGPVFNDFNELDEEKTPARPAAAAIAPLEPAAPPAEPSAKRSWMTRDGTRVEGAFVNVFGDQVALKTPKGDVVKISRADLAAADQRHLTLINPPKLKIFFKKETKSAEVPSNPDMNNPVPMATDFAGGAVVELENKRKNYDRPLRLELYVISDEYDGDNFILHDRRVTDFTLTPENNKRFEFYGRERRMLRYEHYSGKVRGQKHKGYMILVRDERGELLAKSMSHDWLFDIHDKLKVFPVGRHFNKQGERVSPPRPPFTDQYWDHEP